MKLASPQTTRPARVTVRFRHITVVVEATPVGVSLANRSAEEAFAAVTKNTNVRRSIVQSLP